MSRIGKLPITVPAGVEVKISDTNEITVKGKNGTLSRQLHPDMIVKLNDGVITVERPSEDKMHKSLHGLTRTLVNNMVIGVTEGFTKELEINGVGSGCLYSLIFAAVAPTSSLLAPLTMILFGAGTSIVTPSFASYKTGCE